jgi:hypothetical protein
VIFFTSYGLTDTYHTQGVRQKSPNFELFPDNKPSPPTTCLDKSSTSISLTSGSLTATIDTREYSYGLKFSSTESSPTSKPLFLCGTEPKGTAVVDVPISYTLNQFSESSVLEQSHDALTGLNDVGVGRDGKIRFMLNELSLSVGETIYGLGERFTPLVKNGGSHSTWNQGELDGTTSGPLVYRSKLNIIQCIR